MNINACSILYFLYFPSLLMWIKEREISHLRLVSEDSIPLILLNTFCVLVSAVLGTGLRTRDDQ